MHQEYINLKFSCEIYDIFSIKEFQKFPNGSFFPNDLVESVENIPNA